MKMLITKVFLISLLLSLNVFGQSEQANKYYGILDALNLNYVLDYENGVYTAIQYFEPFHLNEAEHKNYLKIYQQSLSEFRKSNKDVINYLLKFENDNQWVYWIRRPHPYSSVIGHILIDKSESALILIDYFLIGNTDRPEKKPYHNKLNYRKLKRFLRKHHELPLEKLRLEYNLFLKNKILKK